MRENRKNIAAGAAFVALIVGFLILISAITTTSDSQETQLVYDAVKNAALPTEVLTETEGVEDRLQPDADDQCAGEGEY